MSNTEQARIALTGCWWQARNADSDYGDIVTDMGYEVVVPGVTRQQAEKLIAAAMRGHPGDAVVPATVSASVLLVQRIAELEAVLQDCHRAGLSVLNGCLPLRDPANPHLLPSQSYLENWRVRELGIALQKVHKTLAALTSKQGCG